MEENETQGMPEQQDPNSPERDSDLAAGPGAGGGALGDPDGSGARDEGASDGLGGIDDDTAPFDEESRDGSM